MTIKCFQLTLIINKSNVISIHYIHTMANLDALLWFTYNYNTYIQTNIQWAVWFLCGEHGDEQSHIQFNINVYRQPLSYCVQITTISSLAISRIWSWFGDHLSPNLANSWRGMRTTHVHSVVQNLLGKHNSLRWNYTIWTHNAQRTIYIQ